MALPSNTDFITMDWGLSGRPFVSIPSTPSIDTLGMDWGLNGQPFVTNPSGVLGPTNLKSLFGVAKANIKSINGVPLANIKSINGVA